MSNQKIGFYFEESLPDVTIPLADDFSFYYIKNLNSENKNIPLLFLYNQASNSFVRLSEPEGYYAHSANNKKVVDGNINLGLNDILTIDNSTNKAIKINTSQLYTFDSNTYFSNFTTSQLNNVQTWVSNTIVGNNFGDPNIELVLTNNVILGQSIGFTNNELTNNIVIGNNLNNLVGNNYKANNNMYIGGTYYSETIPSFIDNNIIQDNIFIKNLGFGNTQQYFKFVSPLKLSDNTPTINDISLVDKNEGYVLIERTTGINKLVLAEFGLNTILGFSNQSDKGIVLNNLKIENKVNNIILSENNFIPTNFNSVFKNIYIGTTDLTDDIELNNSINIGNKSLMNASDSLNIGNNNFKYLVNSLVIGHNNSTTATEASHNFVNNTVLGSKNFKDYTGYVANNIVVGSNNHKENFLAQENITIANSSNKNSTVNKSIIVGNSSNNFNTGDSNLIFGNNKGNTVAVERSGNLLLGNGAESKLVDNDSKKFIIHNYTDLDNTTQEPLIEGSFKSVNPYIRISGKLIINPLYILNANNDITFTKVIATNSLGEIGSIEKNSLFTISPGYRLSQHGINNLSYGNMNSAVTGEGNNSWGNGALEKISSGNYNVGFGTEALKYLTTGSANLAIGSYAMSQNAVTGTPIDQTGKHNIAIGVSAAGNIENGHRNIVVGNGSVSYIVSGTDNLVLGYSAGVGIRTGKNNIFIGNGAGGTSKNGPDVSNKLAIESRKFTNNTTTLWDDITTVNDNYKTSLISGDFDERWINFNGKFSITPVMMPNANTDPLFIKDIVAKADGTIGWKDKTPPIDYSYSLEEKLTGINWHDGNPVYRRTFVGDNLTTPLSQSEIHIQIAELNIISDIVKIDGNFTENDLGMTLPLSACYEPFLNSNEGRIGIYISKNEGILVLNTRLDNSTVHKGKYVITLEYTKLV